MQAEQVVEETIDEFTALIAAEVTDQEKVKEVEIDEKQKSGRWRASVEAMFLLKVVTREGLS